MRILSFVGTRPEIIKSLALYRSARSFPEIEFLLAHTGQNSGAEMADCFFKGLEIPIVKSNAVFDRATMGSTSKSLIDFVHSTIEEYRPDIVISNTDTDTAFYTAFATFRKRIPIAHIEGGIRCDERWNVEEINRTLADHLANWVFTISHEDSEALLREGFSKGKIFMSGDITLDTLNLVLNENKIVPVSGDYDLLTTHRQENANNPERLIQIIDAVEAVGFPTVFPIHPRTRDCLEKSGLLSRLIRSKNIKIANPQSYIDMCRLLANSRKVISDSGGLRREAYMLNKPVISLVSFVWFKEMNRLGFEYCADADTNKIRWAIENYNPTEKRPALFGDGNAASNIFNFLLEQNQSLPRPNGKVSKQNRGTVQISSPCFNEQDSLPTYFTKIEKVMDSLKSDGWEASLLLIDDGSKDKTLPLLESFAEGRAGVKVVSHAKNMGYGAAIKTAMALCDSDWLVFVDVDSNYDQQIVLELMSRANDNVDLLNVSIFAPKGGADYGWHRKLLSSSASLIYRAVFPLRTRGVYTMTCGFRLYRGAIVKSVFPEANDFFATAEILLRAFRHNINVVDIPAKNSKREFGKSKMKVLKNSLGHLRLVLKARFGMLSKTASIEEHRIKIESPLDLTEITA